MMIQQKRILEQDGKFYITASDFSDLVVLDSALNDFTSTIGFGEKQLEQQQQTTPLKIAKFKRIDWNALDKKLAAKPAGAAAAAKTSRNQQKMKYHSTDTRAQEDNDLLPGASQEAMDRKVDWAHYLPRLRKSLRGAHPAELQGNFWPQQQRTFTYGNISPMLMRGRRQQHTRTISPTAHQNKIAANQQNKVMPPLQNESIRDSMVVKNFQQKYAKQQAVESFQTAASPSETMPMIDLVKPTDRTPPNKLKLINVYEYQNQDTDGEQSLNTLNMNSPTLVGLNGSVKSDTFQSARRGDQKNLSPRFTKLGVVNEDIQPSLNQSYEQDQKINADDNQSITEEINLVGKFQDQVINQNDMTAAPRVGGKTKSSIGKASSNSNNQSSLVSAQNVSHGSKLVIPTPFSNYQNEQVMRTRNSGRNSTQATYQVKTLHQNSDKSDKTQQLLSQLKIDPMKPKSRFRHGRSLVEAEHMQKYQQQQLIEHQVLRQNNFQDMVGQNSAAQFRRQQHPTKQDQMQVFVDMQLNQFTNIGGRKQSHAVERMQSNGSLFKHQPAYDQQFVLSQTPAPQANEKDLQPQYHQQQSVTPAPLGTRLTASSKKSLSISNKLKNQQQQSSQPGFQQCIRDLYRKEGQGEASGTLNHHTSEYLSRVERIREETSKTPLILQKKPLNQPSELVFKTMEQSEQVVQGMNLQENLDSNINTDNLTTTIQQSSPLPRGLKKKIRNENSNQNSTQFRSSERSRSSMSGKLNHKNLPFGGNFDFANKTDKPSNNENNDLSLFAQTLQMQRGSRVELQKEVYKKQKAKDADFLKLKKTESILNKAELAEKVSQIKLEGKIIKAYAQQKKSKDMKRLSQPGSQKDINSLNNNDLKKILEFQVHVKETEKIEQLMQSGKITVEDDQMKTKHLMTLQNSHNSLLDPSLVNNTQTPISPQKINIAEELSESPKHNNIRKPIINFNMNSGENSDEGATQGRGSAYETQSLLNINSGRNILVGQRYPDCLISAQNLQTSLHSTVNSQIVVRHDNAEIQKVVNESPQQRVMKHQQTSLHSTIDNGMMDMSNQKVQNLVPSPLLRGYHSGNYYGMSSPDDTAEDWKGSTQIQNGQVIVQKEQIIEDSNDASPLKIHNQTESLSKEECEGIDQDLKPPSTPQKQHNIQQTSQAERVERVDHQKLSLQDQMSGVPSLGPSQKPSLDNSTPNDSMYPMAMQVINPAFKPRQMKQMQLETPTRSNEAALKKISHPIQLEQIKVRKYQPPQPIEQNEEKKDPHSHHGGVNYFPNRQSQELQKRREIENMQNPNLTVQKQLNLSSIPDSIRTQALIKSGMIVGPRRKFRSISNQRNSEVNNSHKAKKIEDLSIILNRVVRANCCLQPQIPEDINVLSRAVGDGSEYFENPSTKAFRIRLKFLNNNFLQDVTEDFMAIQNMDRNVESTITTTDQMFRQFEIDDPQEQQLMIRLYKRFYFTTIQKKYGYLKNVKDKIQISGQALCGQLELNPKVLRLVGVVTSFGNDAMINWIEFLKIMCLFLLQKELFQTRLEFIVRFLFLKNAEDLDKADYIQDCMQRFQFKRRGLEVANVPTLALWDRIRVELNRYREELFIAGKQTIDAIKAVKILLHSGIEAEDTFCFFDMIHESI